MSQVTPRLDSPRWWTVPARRVRAPGTFNALAAVPRGRTTPELCYLPARFAGLVSYRLSAALLSEILTAGPGTARHDRVAAQEDWHGYATLTGAPQGGVASPVLSNIYRDRFDQYIEQRMQVHNLTATGNHTPVVGRPRRPLACDISSRVRDL